MSKFNMDNREKVTVESSSGRAVLNVARNTESSSDLALYVEFREPKTDKCVYAAFSLDAAKEVRDAIDSVIHDFEEIEVEKALEAEMAATAVSRLLDSLPIGSVVQMNEEATRWTKKSKGWVTHVDNVYASPSTEFDGWGYTVNVKYNPEED